MADVLKKDMTQYLKSAPTHKYTAPVTTDWFINPDLTAVAGVPQKYWKDSGGQNGNGEQNIVEMLQAEKDAVDAADLPALKKAKNNAIRANTLNVYAAGFEHPAASGTFLPLDSDSRLEWHASAEFAAQLDYPYIVFDVDDNPVSVANQGVLTQYRNAAVTGALAIKVAENDLLQQVFDAVDAAAVAAIVDNR
jgi:hypothetical protein